mgnify:CR=1 FL=1
MPIKADDLSRGQLMKNLSIYSIKTLHISIGLLGLTFLSACEDGVGFNLGGATSSEPAANSVELIERDVEAPDVFQVTEAGLWDGRPSLGGVWVAHPDVQDPERVIIRNSKNNKFVIGALFGRERESAGPRLQVSSDAAAALGMLAGAPSNLNVTALRRQAVSEPVEVSLDAPSEVETSTLAPTTDTAVAVAAATPAQPAPKPASNLSKPFIQIGIFSVEQNAKNTATSMRGMGIVPIVKKHTTNGKTFWRVIVGPAATTAERSELFKKVKSVGFGDAYAVTN